MSTLIIIPTYNERENIVPLVERILDLADHFEVLVIDDNSPDGTSDEVRLNFEKSSRVHLLQRERKLGLGTAYTAGFRYALAKGYDYAITMDADFSHDPAHIPQIQEQASQYDLVIGSRYVPGGATVNWGALRKVISRTANLLAHHFLSMKPTDCTSGFRLYHAEALKVVEFETIAAEGYSYLVEILFRAASNHLKIGEVPITFVERRKGKSKISRKEIYKAIQTMIRLRLHPPEATGRVALRA